MGLTDTFIKNTKHSGKAAGDKHSDGGGLYLHIKAAGKYWRLGFAGRRSCSNGRQDSGIGVGTEE